MEVTAIVVTFGSLAWAQSGLRATAATMVNNPDHLIHHLHAEADNIADARNMAVEERDPQGWICFVDGDDELEPGYLNAMTAAPDGEYLWPGLLTPSLRIVSERDRRRRREPNPVDLTKSRDISTMNPCPIGTLIHRRMFDEVGGFWDERAWEDWSLFRRAWLLGATIVPVPDAVYRANISPTGRNSTVRNPKQLRDEIISSHDVWLAAR